MSQRRSRGRPNPSRGARVERRKEARRQHAAGPSGPTVMRIPDAIRNLTHKEPAVADIHPAQRAQFDRELSTAVELLLAKAAEHDGKDIVEANVDLTNWLLARVDPSNLAAAAAMLALRLHRQGANRG